MHAGFPAGSNHERASASGKRREADSCRISVELLLVQAKPQGTQPPRPVGLTHSIIQT